MNNNTPATTHPFEKAGLGKAPFSFVSYYHDVPNRPNGMKLVGTHGSVEVWTKPGMSCDYCGEYIVHVFTVRSADGREFKVGSTCIRKTSSKGDRILTYVEKEVRRHKREARYAKAQRDALHLDELLASEEVRTTLAHFPHPNEYMAKQGHTLLEYATWMLENAGMAGKQRALRLVRKHADG